MPNKKKLQVTILELAGIKSSMENVMLSKELGIINSLLLHRNIKKCKPALDDYDEQIKIINHQSYETVDGNIKYDDVTQQPKLLPGKITELKASIKKLNEQKVKIEFEVIKVSELPKNLGQVNGQDLYMFIPALFDYVIVEDSETLESGN